METKLIMENWKKFNENPFQLMLEQYDRKVINETQLYERWEKQTIREFKDLVLKEDVRDFFAAASPSFVDFEKEADLTADPNYKTPKERASEMFDGVSEKVADFILKKSIQIVEMAKSAVFAALRAAKKLYDMVAGFCSEHPLFCKVVGMALLVIIVYLIAAIIYSPSAQAKLTQGGKPLGDNKFQFIKGVTNDLVNDPMSSASKNMGQMAKALTELEKMQASPKNFDIDKLKGVSKIIAKFGSREYDELLKLASDQSLKMPDRKESLDLIKKMIDLGRRTKAWYSTLDVGGDFGANVKAGIGTLKNIPK